MRVQGMIKDHGMIVAGPQVRMATLKQNNCV